MSNSILVVEDNEDLMVLFQLVLESAGYKVTAVSNGKDALDYLGDVQPQLILMDIMMPGVSGLEITRKIKDESDYRSLPVVLVSAIDCLRDEQLLSSKADDIIYKPFDINDLIGKVDQLIA